MRRMFVVVAFVALGVVAARGGESREVRPTQTEVLAITQLNVRAGELAQARARLDADTASVISEIRERHGILASEDFSFDQARGVFVVTAKAAETGTK